MPRHPRLVWAGLLMMTILALFLTGCLRSLQPERIIVDSSTPTQTSIPPTFTLTATASFTPSPTATATITFTPEPLGCQKPPDDYTRVEVNGWTINQRTFAMLAHAQELYGGELELTGHAITQGSYHDNGSYSFGTHLGGGAIDLSVMRYGTYTVLWDDVDPLLRALRAAGFAACGAGAKTHPAQATHTLQPTGALAQHASGLKVIDTKKPPAVTPGACCARMKP